MDENRQNLRRHIKAASDWLIQAEKSIESKNDVQGDLKIMLAKAELQNAEKHRKQTHIKKILAMAAAAVIAFGLYSLKNTENTPTEPAAVAFNETTMDEINENANEKIQSKSTLSTSNETYAETQIESKAIEVESVDEVSNLINETESAIYEEMPETQYVQQDFDESYYETKVELVESQTLSTTEKYEYEMPPAISKPSEDMQKLMQSAGKILRAE